MSLHLLTILSPPTPCTPVLRSLCSPQARSRSCRFPFRVGFRSGLHLTPSRVRQCIRPYRVHHFLNYGLVIRFRLLPTPSLDDAVAFSYGQPVLCPMGTSTPLLVRTFRRTRAAVPRSRGSPISTPLHGADGADALQGSASNGPSVSLETWRAAVPRSRCRPQINTLSRRRRSGRPPRDRPAMAHPFRWRPGGLRSLA